MGIFNAFTVFTIAPESGKNVHGALGLFDGLFILFVRCVVFRKF